jgi:MFS family permease
MARARNPLVPLELFRSRNFTVTNISTLLIYGSLYVNFQFLALFAIGILGYNEVAFGLIAIPSSLLLALFSRRFGALADRYGPRLFMTLGPALMGLGLLWYVRMPADSAPWRIELAQPATLAPPNDFLVDILPAIIVFGIGLMIMVAPLTTALMRSVPVRHAGVASAFNNAISRAGPQLAGALLFIVISSTFYASLSDQAPTWESGSGVTREQVSPLNPAPSGASPELRSAADQASTDAFRLAMLIAALMCLGGAAVNGLGIRNDRLSSGVWDGTGSDGVGEGEGAGTGVGARLGPS